MKKWAILLDGKNVWTTAGKPETFDSMQQAMDALDAFMADEEEAFRRGDIEDVCDADDYRIEEIDTEETSL